jgi:hypothetical protein
MTLVYSALSQVATIHSLTRDSHLFQVEILGFRILVLIKFRTLILSYLQQKSALYNLYCMPGTDSCGQDVELALAVCLGPLVTREFLLSSTSLLSHPPSQTETSRHPCSSRTTIGYNNVLPINIAEPLLNLPWGQCSYRTLGQWWHWRSLRIFRTWSTSSLYSR